MKHLFFARVSVHHAVRRDDSNTWLWGIVCCAVCLWLLASQGVLAQCQDLDTSSTLFQGLGHVPLGQAQLSVTHEVLTVDNLGSSGDDGTAITLGDGMGAPFFETSIDFAAHPLVAGDKLTLWGSGPVSGLPETFIRMRLEGVGSDIKVHPEFRTPQLTSYRAVVSNGDQIIASMNSLTGQLGELHISPDSHLHLEIKAAGALVLNAVSTPFVWQDLEAGPVPVTRVALTTHDLPEDARLCTISWKAQHLDRFDITTHRIGFQSLAVQAFNNTTVVLQEDVFELSNLGSGINQGAAFDTHEATAWELDLVGMDPDTLPPGSWIDISSTETSNEGGTTQSLAMRWEAQPDLWYAFFEFTVDQNTVPYHLQILSDGQSMGQTGPLVGLGATLGHGTPSSWSAELDPQTGFPVLRILLGSIETITPTGGASVLGNEIRVRPDTELGSLPWDALHAIRIRANGFGKVSIENSKSKKKEKPQGTFSSSITVTSASCIVQREPPPPQIQHYLQLHNPTNQKFCFKVNDYPMLLFTSNGSNSMPIPPQQQTICVDPEAFCQVGLTGWTEPGARCAERQASLTDLQSGQIIQINNQNWIRDLEDCPASIQICDDELIFKGDFEPGDTSQWSATVP